MRVTYLVAAIVGVMSVTLGIAQNDAGLGFRDDIERRSFRVTIDTETVDGCLICHREALSLSGRPPVELAEQIDLIVAGTLAHPVALPQLSDTETAELAAALTGE